MTTNWTATEVIVEIRMRCPSITVIFVQVAIHGRLFTLFLDFFDDEIDLHRGEMKSAQPLPQPLLGTEFLGYAACLHGR